MSALNAFCSAYMLNIHIYTVTLYICQALHGSSEDTFISDTLYDMPSDMKVFSDHVSCNVHHSWSVP